MEMFRGTCKLRYYHSQHSPAFMRLINWSPHCKYRIIAKRCPEGGRHKWAISVCLLFVWCLKLRFHMDLSHCIFSSRCVIRVFAHWFWASGAPYLLMFTVHSSVPWITRLFTFYRIDCIKTSKLEQLRGYRCSGSLEISPCEDKWLLRNSKSLRLKNIILPICEDWRLSIKSELKMDDSRYDVWRSES